MQCLHQASVNFCPPASTPSTSALSFTFGFFLLASIAVVLGELYCDWTSIPFFILWFSILILPLPDTCLLHIHKKLDVFVLPLKKFFGKELFLASSIARLLRGFIFRTKTKSLIWFTMLPHFFGPFWQPFEFWILWAQDIFICDLLIITVLWNQVRSSLSFPEILSKIIICYPSLKTYLICAHSQPFLDMERFLEIKSGASTTKVLHYCLCRVVACPFQPHLYFIE